MKKRTTLYLDSELMKLLKIRAIKNEQSISDYVSKVVYQDLLEEQKDLKEIRDILKEPTISFEKMLKELKIDKDV